jgi:ABC-type polysaccharide/polyol phosphate export permease
MRNKLNLLVYFLKKDIKAKYAGSGLGILWTVLMPIIQILLFWFVFSTIMRARPYADTQIPYIHFLLSSFFFWLAFSEGIIRSATSIIENAEMVKKVVFPNIILPVTVTIASYMHHMVGFIIFIIVFSIMTSFSPITFLILPVLFLQLLFSLGLGMLLSALLPYLRDVGQILGPAMQAIFFLSPIIYSIEAVPEQLKIIFYLNPMTYFASSYHQIILMKSIPPLTYIAVILILSTATFFFGRYAFKKLRNGFSDIL